MSLRLLSPETFLQRAANCPVFDARTPAEFGKAHIPGAHNLPLFSDEERHQIGILACNTNRIQANFISGDRERWFIVPILSSTVMDSKTFHRISVLNQIFSRKF